MKLCKHTLHVLFFVVLAFTAGAQTRTALEDQAYAYLNSRDYAKAYDAFDKLYARYPKEMLYQFNLGVSSLHYVEKKDRAIEIFKDMKEKYKTLEVEVYLGKAYHANYKFDEAIATLTPLVDLLSASKKKEDRDLVADVKLTIRNCENAKLLINNKVIADIENIGGPINTEETEGVPIITADESIMIYTYIGKNSLGGKMNATMSKDTEEGMYLSDIYISKKDSSGTKWSTPEPVNSLNTKGNDAAIAISPDGLTLFIFLSNNENEGDILVSQLTGSQFSPPVPLNANINTPEHWEGSCSISADGRYLYFSSERPGGFGGRDLYISEKVNGDWGPAVNMGSKVNTEYDDDAPFIHPDGITLFFSSKGHTSIGGYDIMFTYKEGNEWTTPRSMGIPLNTVEDDSYYVINSKGDKGFFSSNRKAKGGMGEQDIYMVTPGVLGEKPVVALLKGTVFGSDKPIEAKIEVVKTAKQESIGPYYSNKETGKYLMALSPGFIYRIVVKAEGFGTVEEDFDIEHLSAYMEKSKDFYLYPPSATPAETTTAAAPVETTTTAPPTETTATAPTETTAAAPTETTTAATTTSVTETPSATATSTETPAAPEGTVAAAATNTTEPVTTQTTSSEPTTLASEKPKEPIKEEPVEDPVMKNEKKTSGKTEKTKKGSDKTKTVEVETSGPCESTLPDLSPVKGGTLNEGVRYQKLIELVGNYCSENLKYTVQIGAYKSPENFKYNNLKGLGEVNSESYPDGITRFTQNQFSTLNQAEKARRKAIARGQKDAWIVAFINGKRYTLEDLIMVDFMAKPAN